MQKNTGKPTIGDAVRALRESFGESQRDFAARLRCSLNSVAKWEIGHMKPGHQRLELLVALARERGLHDATQIFQRELTGDRREAFIELHHQVSFHVPSIHEEIAQLKKTISSPTETQQSILNRLDMHVDALMHEITLMGQAHYGDVEAK